MICRSVELGEKEYHACLVALAVVDDYFKENNHLPQTYSDIAELSSGNVSAIYRLPKDKDKVFALVEIDYRMSMVDVLAHPEKYLRTRNETNAECESVVREYLRSMLSESKQR